MDLTPWCQANTAKRHNQWKGFFGWLDWEKNFPTSVTDPQPMGKVGICFHAEQDRIITLRECARSQESLDQIFDTCSSVCFFKLNINPKWIVSCWDFLLARSLDKGLEND